ncbi:CBS domain-containing protein [Aquibacillus sp. 3ASR75-11]|uniref:CBS domain-containing protein n=1 Tax=Terrihalobacillus insolitus TaxID=2950438 RepID=A0A9X3WRX3_9BACI|nr:CBS domain-containing protein [Terrihalobacillus insolitus]MDC3412805.1 CBS domain-containing protein [Terrihalobacillus insolitus]MDC3423718.1 CBS domain-containing protein [Terrihalobacillus insolitus]
MKSVKDIMATDLTICKLDDELSKVANEMKNHDVGAIPVCEENRELIGMVTDRDLVLRGYAAKKDGSAKIREVMSDDLYTADPGMSVQEASKFMAEKQIRRLPIVENGKLIGIVSLGDLALERKSNDAAGQALEEISEHHHHGIH